MSTPLSEARDDDRADTSLPAHATLIAAPGCEPTTIQLRPPAEPSRGSVLLDVCGGAWQRQGDCWYTATSNLRMFGGWSWREINARFGPLRLIYDYEADPQAVTHG